MPSDDDRLRCRVCGLPQATPPWGADGRTPSFDICPCCGTEFGYEDTTTAAILEQRRKWLASGAKWFSPKQKPAIWNLHAQLAAIPAPYRP